MGAAVEKKWACGGHGGRDRPSSAAERRVRGRPRLGLRLQRGMALCMVSHFCTLLAGAVLLSGCAGYQIGNKTLYPADIHTVYVPVFASSSFRRQLGERLTEAVIKEIELKTPYKVVGDANADSILSGRITGETKRVLVENRYDEPREVETNLQVQVQWLDRQRNLIRQMEPIPVPPELVSITESATLIPEVGQSVAVAHQQAIQRLAQQIVSMMEAPW